MVFFVSRPVSGLLDIDICRVNPIKLIQTLNKVLLSSHGSFQATLIAHTNTFDMKPEITSRLIMIFKRYNTLGSIRYSFLNLQNNLLLTFNLLKREYQNKLFITYSDAKYAYQAYYDLNNTKIESTDLLLKIDICNQINHNTLIQQELMDCLKSLNYFKSNIRKASETNITCLDEMYI